MFRVAQIVARLDKWIGIRGVFPESPTHDLSHRRLWRVRTVTILALGRPRYSGLGVAVSSCGERDVSREGARSGRIGWAGLLVTDLDVADESPSADLELGTLARFHANALIAEECAAARDHPSTG